MKSFLPSILAALILCTVVPAEARQWHRKPPSYDVTAMNDGASSVVVTTRARGSAVVRAGVLLDRAHFSSAEIDGAFGQSMRGAVTGFQVARNLKPTGVVDAATWKVLNQDSAPAVVPYIITSEEAAAPFVPLPGTMAEKAKLTSLGYETLLESLGEKFHAAPALLRTMNAGKHFVAGETILVPNVRTEGLPGKAALVVVDGSAHNISVFDAENRLMASYPASVGSRHDPLPVGTWKINGVERDPVFHYNPGLFWDALRGDKKAVIPAGPNNPVGAVWIDLSKEHYGIHGTPQPSMIGKSYSHGCIRLTNWDALELAAAVSPGTKTILQLKQ